MRQDVDMVPPPDWLDRYRAGQRDQVWHELRQLVCNEMARRARHNVEVIIERLTGAGYRFHTNNDAQDPVTPHVPPSAGAAAHADWLADRFGPVPMTLLSWIRLAGDVWLVGTHPQWPESASADPLVIEAEGSRYPSDPIRGYFDEDHDMWRRWAARDPEQAGLFVLPLSPDRVHKENVSGGAPYGLILPDGCADGLDRDAVERLREVGQGRGDDPLCFTGAERVPPPSFADEVRGADAPVVEAAINGEREVVLDPVSLEEVWDCVVDVS